MTSRHRPSPLAVMVRLVRTIHAFLRRRGRRWAPLDWGGDEERDRRAFEAGRRQGHAEGLTDAEAFFTRSLAALRRECDIARHTTGRRRGI